MDLTRAQVKEIIAKRLTSQGGLEDLLSLLMEIIMEGERSIYLDEHSDLRNGFRPRKIMYEGNLLELRVPRTRLRGFMPRLLCILKDQEEEMSRLCSLMYSQGSTMEDISKCFEVLYGKQMSTSSINRLSVGTKSQVDEFLDRKLPNRMEALMIDATFISVRRGSSCSKEAFFVAMGLTTDGRREIVGIYNNPTEGSHIWSEFFENLKLRGLKELGLIVSDGLNGIEEVAAESFPGVAVQLCAIHKQRELLNKVRPRDKTLFTSELKEVFSTESTVRNAHEGVERMKEFCRRWGASYPFLLKFRESPRLPFYFTYLDYAPQIRPFIYSTNWVERFNRQIKKASSYKGALPSVDAAIYLIGLISLNSKYLNRKIGNLSAGLTKSEYASSLVTRDGPGGSLSSSGAASPRADARPLGVFHVAGKNKK